MRVLGASLFLLTLILALATAAPDLTFVDSGELAAVAATLGIAHPTGYPLFTLIGRLATVIPGPHEPIMRLTWLSGVWVALGSLVFYFFLNGLLPRLRRPGGRSPAEAPASDGAPRLAPAWIAFATSLALASAATVWQQAVVVEVYALGFFLLAALLWLAERAAARGGSIEILFAYAAGVAVTNHGSVAPLVPALALPMLDRWGVGRRTAIATILAGGLAVVALPVERRGAAALLVVALSTLLRDRAARAAWRRLLAQAIAALLGLSLYAYLPIRSALDPPLDWGDPEHLATFIRHVTGRVFHVWFFSSWDTALTQLGHFARQISAEMTPLAVPLMLVGAVLLWRRERIWAAATSIIFAVNVLYSVNYDIHDISTYFIPSIMMAAVWVAVALEALAGRWHRPAAMQRLALIPVILLPVTVIIWNYPLASRRHDYLVKDYSDAMFQSLAPHAVLLSRQWDTFCSASIYEQLVRGIRRDVTVVEKELMRRSWYLTELARWDPELASPCREQLGEFAAALVPFERGEPCDARLLQERYLDAIHCLLASGEAAGRPIYLTQDVRSGEPDLARQYVDVPVGLAVRLYRQLPDAPPPPLVPEVRGIAAAARSTEPLRAQLAGLVLEMITRRAAFEAQQGHLSAARSLLGQALAIDPDYAHAQRVLLGVEMLEREGSRPEAPGGVELERQP